MQYLSNAEERLKWQANALPSDDLCSENAIMIKRFNRYPLIIDPSGQATEFIMREYRDKKITKTRCVHVYSKLRISVVWSTTKPIAPFSCTPRVQEVHTKSEVVHPTLPLAS